MVYLEERTQAYALAFELEGAHVRNLKYTWRVHEFGTQEVCRIIAVLVLKHFRETKTSPPDLVISFEDPMQKKGTRYPLDWHLRKCMSGASLGPAAFQ